MTTESHIPEKLRAIFLILSTLSIIILLTYYNHSDFQPADTDFISPSGISGNGEILEQTVAAGSASKNQLKPSTEVSSLKNKPHTNFQLNKSSATALIQLPNASKILKQNEYKAFFGYLKLVGTTIFGYNPLENKAIIEDLLTSRQKLYAVGSIIPYGAKIIRIHEKGIVLEKEGVRRPLALAAKLGNPDDIVVLKSKGYKRVAENEWLIRPNRLIGDTENIYKLLMQASIRPSIDAGRIKGFSINEIKQGALVKELGIEDGDVINTVNAETIDNLAKTYQVYQRIRKETVINIGLRRRQQEVHLVYHLVADGPPKYSVKDALWSRSVAKLFMDK